MREIKSHQRDLSHHCINLGKIEHLSNFCSRNVQKEVRFVSPQLFEEQGHTRYSRRDKATLLNRNPIAEIVQTLFAMKKQIQKTLDKWTQQ